MISTTVVIVAARLSQPHGILDVALDVELRLLPRGGDESW
jgi:hypothetical protein